MKIKNPRLFFLTVTTIVLAIIYIIIEAPFSAVSVNNICMDTELANEHYTKDKNDILALKAFAQKRTDQCKILLKAHKNETKIYKKMENCDMFASAASASGFLINLASQYQDYKTLKKELEDAEKYMKPYAYCPQYNGVKILFDSIRQRNADNLKTYEESLKK